MTLANNNAPTETSHITLSTRETGAKTLALYAVGLGLTLLLNWYLQPYTLFWG